MKYSWQILILLMLLSLQLMRGTNSLTNCSDYTDLSNDCQHNSVMDKRQCTNDSTCPTWFTCNLKNECTCDNSHTDTIICNDKDLTSAVFNCICVTYDIKSRSTFAGECFYNCKHIHHNEKDLPIQQLPNMPQLLINKSVCALFHRTGLLCGDCEEGHWPFVLSYNLSCVECPDGHKNWWKFIVVGFVPMTFFYFIVVIFNINVTSSRLHSVVWFSQAVSMPGFVRIMLLSLRLENEELLKLAKVLFSLYTFWNLDVFRPVIPDICLNVSTLQALALDYLIACYPFALIVLSYFLIYLHDRNVSILVAAWKPIKKVIALFKTTWNIRTSVIDSFATFFLLSYVKIVSVSVDILIPTRIYQLGSNNTTYGWYYSSSIAYLGEHHRPYAILAILMLLLFVFIPTLTLAVYPFKIFQRFLSLFPLNWHFLHAFVDSFQGCYKDGTEPGTIDCRCFSVSMPLIRLLLLVIYGSTLSVMYFVYATIALILLQIVLINVQPLKKTDFVYSLVDMMFTFLLSFCHITLALRGVANDEKHFSYRKTLTIVALFSGLIPLVYTFFLVCSWLFTRSRRVRVCVPRLLIRHQLIFCV